MRSVRKYRKALRVSHQAASILPESRYPRRIGHTILRVTAPLSSSYSRVIFRPVRIASRSIAARMRSGGTGTGAMLVAGSSIWLCSAAGTTASILAIRFCAARASSGSPRLATQLAPSIAASSSSGVSINGGIEATLQDIADPRFADDGYPLADKNSDIPVDGALRHLQLFGDRLRRHRIAGSSETLNDFKKPVGAANDQSPA